MLMNEIKKELGNQIFSVTFVKKNGDLRDMTCRLGVKKHLKGGKLAHDPKELNHLVVFDMVKKAYRTINFNTIRKLTVNGETYEFTS